ncbi:Mpo1-like protein [Halpernia sp. GG3]
MPEKIKNFSEFYQFYLTEHSKTWTRIFHFIGTFLIFVVIFYVLKKWQRTFSLVCPNFRLWFCVVFTCSF